jgi:orotate phosphoribosyltransferase-like protein
MPEPGRPVSVDYAEAQRLRAQGLSYPEIGRRLDIHHTTAMYACDPQFRHRKRQSNRDRARRP